MVAAALLAGVALRPQFTSSAPTTERNLICENTVVVPAPADHPELVADCTALLALRATLAGTADLDWAADTPLDRWEGVDVGASGVGGAQRVTELDLWREDLDGVIPAELGLLTGLRLLDLSSNELAGSIPAELGQLTALEVLDLERNELTGAIPAELGGLIGVRVLDLSFNELSGAIPPELGGLAGLEELLLTSNALSGSIPAELGQLSKLVRLGLSRNQLSGEIPETLGAIGPTLEYLGLEGPLPLPAGVGLTGRIPPQLGNLSGLRTLHLDGNRLTGPIPTRLGLLSRLQVLRLEDNQLTGEIPTQLGGLSELEELSLRNNQLSSVIPSQLAAVSPLRKLYLRGNTITGCLPWWLGPGLLEFGDLDRLNLPACVGTQPVTPQTPLPTYELTVRAGAGGSVTPSGTVTYEEAAEVVVTASWNDATHRFAGWTGQCEGTTTTCTLEIYNDYTVEVSFTELPAERCAAPGDADCIRAVYLGTPGDYAQVQDIPAELLLRPNSEGRYLVERGEQVTVVTAARLPAGWTRFYLEQDPVERPWPVSFSQLIPPVGTTYTFTISEDEAAAVLIRFDLHAARPNPLGRPGLKPILGDAIVTTEFRVASCFSGTAISDPANNSELARDCEQLVAMRDILAGSGSLDWDVRDPISGWTGVNLGGAPQRVIGLDLAASGLAGELTGLLGELNGLTALRLNDNAVTGWIPSKLTQLTNLTHLNLAGNPLSGCIPPELRNIANHDLDALGLADCGAPTDISYGEHTLSTGTYKYAWVDDGPAVMFDVPVGLSLEIVGIVYTDSDDGGSTTGMILRDTTD